MNNFVIFVIYSSYRIREKHFLCGSDYTLTLFFFLKNYHSKNIKLFCIIYVYLFLLVSNMKAGSLASAYLLVSQP